jgi:hypothetical protein
MEQKWDVTIEDLCAFVSRTLLGDDFGIDVFDYKEMVEDTAMDSKTLTCVRALIPADRRWDKLFLAFKPTQEELAERFKK